MKRKCQPRVYFKHGAFYYVTLDRKWIRLGKTEADMYKALAKLKTIESGAGTMAVYFDRYEKEVLSKNKPQTQRIYLMSLANIRQAFGHMQPDTIKPKHIYAYMDARANTSKSGANAEKAQFSLVFNSMIRWGIVDSNPCKFVKAFSMEPCDRYVTDEEYRAVFDIASPVLKAAMEISYLTGMRKGDILDLKYCDFTEDGIPLTQEKTGKKQFFQWSDGLRQAIAYARQQRRCADSIGYVIANGRGQKYTDDGFGKNWSKLIDRAIEQGLIKDRFTFHSIRAKCASDMELADAQKTLGHSSPSTTKRVYMRKVVSIKPKR